MLFMSRFDGKSAVFGHRLCPGLLVVTDHYLFIVPEAYSNALPPHDAKVPNMPSDGARVCPAIGNTADGWASASKNWQQSGNNLVWFESGLSVYRK